VSDRSAKITQAELERAIRAVKAQGLAIIRIVARADGYAIETAPPLPAVTRRKPVL
jgi:hypothetical protein